VHPPGSEEFESTAVAWLLDVVPPDYRLHGVLRRYPLALAALARYHSKACVEGARQGYRAARTELADSMPPHAIDTVLAAYRKEGARLAATARGVGLVERALRGEVFTPKMPQEGPRTEQPQSAQTEQAPQRTERARQSAPTQQPAQRTEQAPQRTERARPRTERARQSAPTEQPPQRTEQPPQRTEQARQSAPTQQPAQRTERARQGAPTEEAAQRAERGRARTEQPRRGNKTGS
jgi:outer membrane biosynthesis protein TonB